MKLKEVWDKYYSEAVRLHKVGQLMPHYMNIYEDVLDLSGEVFFTLISILSPQQKASLIEKYLAMKFNMKKLPADLARGDFVTQANTTVELKVSFPNKNKVLNVNQVRPHQNIDEYYILYIDDDNVHDSLFFVVPNQAMKTLVGAKGSYSHGTKQFNQGNTKSEYSLRISQTEIPRWKQNFHDEEKLQIMLAED